jgi:cysteine desulfurase
LTTPIEHRAILEPAETLAANGLDVEYLPVDGEGKVDPADVAERIRSDTLLVSVMYANNEVGTIEPIAEIGKVCREKEVIFHSDAVQGFGKTPLNVRELNVDLMSLSAHKMYGPKGVGALFVRRGTRISPYMEGGEQENGRRAGTLNVPAIVGFGAAVRKAEEVREQESARLTRLRDRLIDGVLETVPGARLNGARRDRLSNNAHFCFDGVEGEPLLLSLDMAGVYASAGSACTAGSTEPSHVLMAMGIPVETARGALRLSLGRSTTEEAVDYVSERLCEIVHNLRSLAVTGLRV